MRAGRRTSRCRDYRAPGLGRGAARAGRRRPGYGACVLCGPCRPPSIELPDEGGPHVSELVSMRAVEVAEYGRVAARSKTSTELCHRAGVASGAFSSCEATLEFAPKPVLVAEPQANLEESFARFQTLYSRIHD